MKLIKTIIVGVCVIAVLCIIAVMAFLVLLCNSCGYFNSGSMISGPSQWYNYSAENASYMVVNINCMTLGKNEINVMRSRSDNVTIEAVHGPYISTGAAVDYYDDTMFLGFSSSYGSDMYYGGARLNIYLPENRTYDIKIDTLRSAIRVANFTGTNLVIKNNYSGDLTLDGGNYDYVYIDNGGNINGMVFTNKSMIRSGSGLTNIVTVQPS